MTDCVALVPLRGGSKSIPDKNIRLIAGKPLCAWALEAACRSGVFAQVVVSTDSPRITEVVHRLHLPVEVLDRPAELATDEASTESVMQHAAQFLDFDVLATVQVTTPLVQADDFREAYRLFTSGGYDALVTAVRTKRFFWSDDGTPLNYVPENRPRRQDFPGTLMENGAFYYTRRTVREEPGCRLAGRVCVYEMAADSAVEIDEPADWALVERALRKRQGRYSDDTLAKIKLLVVDVDGTLTDAGMYWSADGDQLKKFNTRDAKGLELLRRTGVDVGIMTSENSPIVIARARKLGIQHCFIGIENKYQRLDALIRDLGLELMEVAYIGDDVNDLDCLESVGFSACPSDAVGAVTEKVHYVSTCRGGSGAVREICDLIRAARARPGDD